MSNWLPEELEILRTVYPQYGLQACMAALPHRSRHAIKSRTRDLGIAMSPAARSLAAVRGNITRKLKPPAAQDGPHNSVLDARPFRWAPSVFDLHKALDGALKPPTPPALPGLRHILQDDDLLPEMATA